jgi:hypothetical protein
MLFLSPDSKQENPLVCPGSALTANILPSSNEERLTWIRRSDVSYLFTTACKPSNTIRHVAIVVEKPGNHLDDGGFVLYSDGAIIWHSSKEIAKLLTPS